MPENNYDVDWTVIAKSEGGLKTKGYVPVCSALSFKHKNPWCVGKNLGDIIGNSNITIGYGVDLGQFSEKDLTKKIGVPEYIVNKLKNHLQLKQDKINTKDLPELLPSEALTLSLRVMNWIFTHIANRYKEDNGKSFTSLSVNIQTAIADYYYQHGPVPMNLRHGLWKSIIANDWLEVVVLLEKQKKDEDRRKHEAMLIMTSPEYLKMVEEHSSKNLKN
jgi:hypothetical protein